MKTLYVATAIGIVLIGVTTVVEGVFIKDRWGSPGIEAAELGKRFNQVPKRLRQWYGVDIPVQPSVQERSGAVRFVNRRYTHELTNQTVDVWLIIGHSRDVIRHTPDICYPNSGFLRQGEKIQHVISYGDEKEGVFFTNKYQKEDAMVRQIQRVYWSWNRPEHGTWEAPDDPRGEWGMAKPSLYKLYFTSVVTGNEKTVDDNIAVEFAEIMLPEIDAALYPDGKPIVEGQDLSLPSAKSTEPTESETSEADSTEADVEESAEESVDDLL